MAVSAAVICNDEGDCWRVKEQSRLQAWIALARLWWRLPAPRLSEL